MDMDMSNSLNSSLVYLWGRKSNCRELYSPLPCFMNNLWKEVVEVGVQHQVEDHQGHRGNQQAVLGNGDQLNISVFFWNLVKKGFSSVRTVHVYPGKVTVYKVPEKYGHV